MMPRPQRRSAFATLIALGCLLLAVGSGCSANQSNAEPVGAVAEATEPAADAAIEPDATSAADTRPKETCYGVLDCSLFGVGAVLAAPFWVLGAFLGLVF
jgi:hypothetical protein